MNLRDNDIKGPEKKEISQWIIEKYIHTDKLLKEIALVKGLDTIVRQQNRFL